MLCRTKNIFASSVLSVVFFTASIFAITRDEAETIAITNAFGNQISSSNVKVTKQLVPPNAEIRCFKTSYKSPANPSWMFFSDDYPGANWSHAARVAFVDAVTGDSKLINVQWPPVAGSADFSLDYDIVVNNVQVTPDPKGLVTTPLSSQIARNSFKKLGFAATNALPKKYAVIICGGGSAGTLYERYYTDIQEMYTTVRNTYGYEAENIYVLCADGDADGNGSIAFDGVDRSMDLDGDGTVDCNGAATKDNITNTFDELDGKMTSDDFLFVFTTDHGGNSVAPPGSIYDEGSLTLWNEQMTDDEFAVAVNQITNYGYEVFCFEQCFSGDMINDLWGDNRVIATAANWDEYSWGRVFSSLWINAVNGSAPEADVNNDLIISMEEAFNYADANDQSGEDPQYYESTTGLGATLSLNGLIGPEPPPPLPSVKIQINTSASAPVTTCPHVQFKLLNVDPGQTVDLTKIEIRYWFSSQTTQAHTSVIDYADYHEPYTVITNQVTSQIVQQIKAPQTHYMSIRFSSGLPLLQPGAENSVVVHSRFNKADWSDFDQTDDWSYIQTMGFVDAGKVAVFYDGTLVWGSEPTVTPPPPPPPSSLKVQFSTYNTNPVSNQLYINVRIYNTSTTNSENISSLDLKYWYSKDGTEPEVVTIDWVGKQTAETTITSQAQATLEPVAIAGQTGVVHLSFPQSSESIEPNAYIEAHLRVNKTNWSNYDQANDYSFMQQSSFVDCNKICLYKANVLVWGIQP